MAFGLGATVFASSRNVKKTEAYYSPSTHYEVSDTASELASYYSSISSSDSGTTLLGKLQSLNSSKKKKDVGYSSMGTGTDGAFIYTDYDLNSTATDSNGQKYGTKVASFYTKTSTTSWNREHTWPKSHGGNLIDDDIHMTRPTITSENSDRGNSFYVEGKNSSSAGWDPYTAGYSKEMRGECARIILYGVVANSSLSLVASDSHSTSNANPDNLMGNMHTLIKWHFDYSPNVYEMNRNNGGEYLQGNRNPFIDHPEYVAKIWSSFDSTVSSLCSQNASMYSNWTPGSYSSYGTNDAAGGSTSTDPAISISASATSVKVGNSITLSATKTNLTGTVQWYVSDSSTNVVSLSATSGDSITVTGVSEGTKTIYAHIGTVSASIEITVKPATSSGTTSTATFDFSSSGNCKATSGSAEGVSFTTAQGSAQNAPAYNSNSGELRMYYATNGNGNTFTLTPDEDYAITGVTITASSTTYTPDVKYKVDGGSDTSGTWSSTTMTISDIEASSSFVFRNANTSNTQLRIKSVAVTLVATGGSSTTPTVNSVTVSPSTLSLNVNGTSTLSATVSVSNGAAQTVTWSSSNASVVTVDSAGKVTAVAAGTATITATSTVDTSKKGTCTVTVSNSSTTQPEHAGTEADPYTTADAKLVMDNTGSGVVYQTEVYVTMVPTSSSFNSSYSQYTCTDSNMTISSASLAFTPKGTYTDANALVGKTVVAKGYIELYNGVYKMGYLPASVSPTGSKYNPSIISITPDEGSGEQSEGVYTLAPAAGSNTSYAGSGNVTIDNVSWAVNGNNSMIPWRIGGKSISNTDRTVTSNAAVSSENISSVKLTVGNADSITVNSLTLKVGTTKGASDVSSVTATFSANSDITFERPSGKDWSNCYFTFVFNVTVSGSSNKFVQFTKAVFYADSSTDGATTFAQEFMNAFTCDATGTNAPTFASGKSWASLKTAFNALSTTDQNTLKNATANESGTDIEKAVARYDYVVAKYSYENFMNRTITSSANRMNAFGGHTTNYILLILGSVSLLGGLTYLAYFLKKRKED